MSLTYLWGKVFCIMGDPFHKASWLHTYVLDGQEDRPLPILCLLQRCQKQSFGVTGWWAVALFLYCAVDPVSLLILVISPHQGLVLAFPAPHPTVTPLGNLFNLGLHLSPVCVQP